MLRNSKKSLRKSGVTQGNQSRPLDPYVLRRAKKLVSNYKILIEQNDKLGYMGTSVEIPTAFADAKTPEKCYKATQQALCLAVATMIQSGQEPPQSSSPEKRTTQINIRLTRLEKLWLSDAAGKLGYKGISEFVRNVALKAVMKNNPL